MTRRDNRFDDYLLSSNGQWRTAMSVLQTVQYFEFWVCRRTGVVVYIVWWLILCRLIDYWMSNVKVWRVGLDCGDHGRIDYDEINMIQQFEFRLVARKEWKWKILDFRVFESNLIGLNIFLIIPKLRSYYF